MPVTCCLTDFDRILRRLPLNRNRWDAELAKLPDTCLLECSPGGCRKHCTEYASGAWIRANQTKPKRGKR
jgi:hypothetical protein